MILHLQYPIADLRLFQSEPTGALPRPLWPSPSPYREFVRCVGQVRPRRRGGLGGWVGEDVVCDASRAIQALGPRNLGRDPEIGLQCASRSFYFDGFVVAKFDVAMITTPHFLESNVDLAPVVHQFLAGPAKTRNMAPGSTSSVAAFGAHLAKHYLRSTTSARAPACSPAWIAPGQLCLVLTCGETERITLPPSARRAAAPTDGVSVAHWWHRIASGGVRVIVLKHDRAGARKDRVRELRILLARLHTEYECLRQVLLGLANDARVEEGIRRDSEFFQFYLNEATRRIHRADATSRELFGPSGESFVIARNAFDSMNPGLREGMIGKLRSLRIRPQVLAKTEGIVNNYFAKEMTMGDRFENIQHATIVNRAMVERSFNKVQKEADEGTAAVLHAVAELVQRSGNREAAENFAAFNEELQRPAPKKSVLHALWGGVVSSLPAVAQMAATVEKIIKMLGS